MSEKIFEYAIWDKKTPIGAATASEILERNHIFNTGDVFIVYVGGVAGYIESVPAIRRKLHIPSTSTDEQVINEYMYNLENNLEQEPKQVQKWKEAENEYKEAKKELFQAKLTLMKEGLI